MFRGIASKIDDVKAQFREAPLLSLARFLVLLGLVTAVIVVIADIAMSWGRISTVSGQFTGAMAEAYTTSAAFAFCGICEAAGLAVAVAYYFQEKESALYREVKPTIILALIALAVTLAGAPLLLGFVENILLIIGIIVVVVILFFALSVSGSGDQRAGKAKGNAKERADNRPVKKVDKGTQVFRSGTVLSGNGIFGYAGWPNDAFYICSESDYDKGKVRIIDRETGKDHSPILPGPPKGAEAALSKWQRQ